MKKGSNDMRVQAYIGIIEGAKGGQNNVSRSYMGRPKVLELNDITLSPLQGEL